MWEQRKTLFWSGIQNYKYKRNDRIRKSLVNTKTKGAGDASNMAKDEQLWSAAPSKSNAERG